MKQEQYLHQSVCQYIRTRYPDVIFTSEPSGLYVTPGQARVLKSMRSDAGLPDLWILEPRGIYHGCLLELKATNIFKKDGSLRKNPHTERQAQVIQKLRSLGYFADFVIGMDEAVLIIDAYMKHPRIPFDTPGPHYGGRLFVSNRMVDMHKDIFTT